MTTNRVRIGLYTVLTSSDTLNHTSPIAFWVSCLIHDYLTVTFFDVKWPMTWYVRSYF